MVLSQESPCRCIGWACDSFTGLAPLGGQVNKGRKLLLRGCRPHERSEPSFGYWLEKDTTGESYFVHHCKSAGFASGYINSRHIFWYPVDFSLEPYRDPQFEYHLQVCFLDPCIRTARNSFLISKDNISCPYSCWIEYLPLCSMDAEAWIFGSHCSSRDLISSLAPWESKCHQSMRRQ